MDLLVLLTVAVALLIIFISLLLARTNKAGREVEQHAEEGNEGLRRRARIARNQRNRLRPVATAAGAAEHVNDGNDDDDDDNEDDNGNNADHRSHSQDVKIGTKKRAKLEAKEQKRIMREHETKMRAEKSAQNAKLELERKKEEEKEAAAEKKQIEMERLQREERERKELEEYLKLKATFSIEEEGYGEDDDAEKENMLASFVQYVKDNKVVVLEDLACEFKLKTQQAIDRIKELQANGTLTGVIDDRGKFIYISPDELKAVAKFIKQRGRISIADLAENSDNLITLTTASST